MMFSCCRRQHNSNTAPRYQPNHSMTPITIAPATDGDGDAQRDVIDVEKVAEKFRVQMVLLQRRLPSEAGHDVPHLLEIHCNCDWNVRRYVTC